MLPKKLPQRKKKLFSKKVIKLWNQLNKKLKKLNKICRQGKTK